MSNIIEKAFEWQARMGECYGFLTSLFFDPYARWALHARDSRPRFSIKYDNRNYQVGAVIFFCLLSSLTPAWAERVCAVHDGDTFTTCGGDKIRLAGIDAPELRQPFGPEAREYLTALVEFTPDMDREVELTCENKLSYGRRVCRAVLVITPSPNSYSPPSRRLDLQWEMVARGLAFDYKLYSHGRYARAEAHARTTGQGVWALPQALQDGGVRPWDFRHGGARK